MLEAIDWLGHASFRIIDDLVIYIDPWKVQNDDKADIILITHPHHDHCSPEDIFRLQKENTVIVTVQDAAEKIYAAGIRCNFKIIKPFDKVEILGTNIEVVPAYNKNSDYHPKEKDWVGFIVEVLGERVYFAGDTDYIPEMRHLKNIEAVFLPIGGEYTMDVDQAVKAALMIGPRYAVPMHYGDIVGGEDDAEAFRMKMHSEDPTIEVVIKTPEYVSD